MRLKEILQTGIELSKVLAILRPQDEYAEANRHFLAFYILSAAAGNDIDEGIACKIVEKYIEARGTPMTEVQVATIQELMDTLSDQGLADKYIIKP